MIALDHISPWRNAQRSALLANRLAIPVTQHREWNATITRLLVQGFPLLQSVVIGIYWPFKAEFDPRFAARHFRRHGATTALPVVIKKGSPLQYRQWRPGDPLGKGVFGLPVPLGTAEVNPAALLIPPVGFDSAGYRLGYGGGYFDRTLAARMPQPLKIGVAFECCRIATIHPQPYDVPMDFIVTEAGIHHVTATGLEALGDPSRAGTLAWQLLGQRNSGTVVGNSVGAANVAAALAPDRPQYASPPCYAHELDPTYMDT